MDTAEWGHGRPRASTRTAKFALVLSVVALLPGAVAVAATHEDVRRVRMPDAAMQPTISPGQQVLAEPRSSLGTDPQVNDIVVFRALAGSAQLTRCALLSHGLGRFGGSCPHGFVRATRIMRVVGRPGDRIAMRSGHVVRNSVVQREPFARACRSAQCSFREVVVPGDAVFVLGDDRAVGSDSGAWGALPVRLIERRVVKCLPLAYFCRTRRT